MASITAQANCSSAGDNVPGKRLSLLWTLNADTRQPRNPVCPPAVNLSAYRTRRSPIRQQVVTRDHAAGMDHSFLLHMTETNSSLASGWAE